MKPNLIEFLIVPVLIIAAINSSSAQDNKSGVAFVQAPEQSSGTCRADTAEKAFACAVKKCTANSTPAEDCLKVKWCFPSGWSADVFMQHIEGPHWHQYLCGWSSLEDLTAAANILCEGSSKKSLQECDIVQIWDSSGLKNQPLGQYTTNCATHK